MKLSSEKKGIVYAVLSYLMWGLTPIYWKLLQHVSSEEILAQRIFWSFIFMLGILLIMKKWSMFLAFIKEILEKPSLLLLLCIASILISANWGIFMWAVIHGRILEASLGQYITPLTSILLGVILLKERLNKLQTISFLLAGIGVFILTFHYGGVPWLSLSLALTFGFYGLVKKVIKTDSTIGLAVETMSIAPLAFLYLSHLLVQTQLQFTESISTSLLLMGSGAVTALPLLLFTKSAKTVSLSMLGILQYISPTLSLLVGVFLYRETLSTAHIMAFIFIWSALALYTFSSVSNRGKKLCRANKTQLDDLS